MRYMYSAEPVAGFWVFLGGGGGGGGVYLFCLVYHEKPAGVSNKVFFMSSETFGRCCQKGHQ